MQDSDDDDFPGDDGEERLYGLIEIAERQQNVAQTALEGMVKERIALGQELQRLTQDIANLQEDVRSMVSKAIEDVRTESEQAGGIVARNAADTLHNILDEVAEQAQRTEATLRRLADWVSWRFLWRGLAGVVALAFLWWLASCAVLWWDTSAIGRAQVRKAQLQVEIAQLEANRDSWVKAGMEGKLSRCGPKQRPCARVDDGAGSFGEKGDYRVLKND